MLEKDANKVNKDSTLETDISIIGGGAAGITIANSLSNLNDKVLLLESGNHAYDQKTQDLYDFENIGYPLRAQKGYISRNRYLGGSTNTWLGRCAPLQAEDFKKREWIPNSGWPISEEDLEPFYPQAAKVLKLPDAIYFKNNAWRKYLLNPPKTFLDDGKLLPTIFLLGKKPINMKNAYVRSLKNSKNVEILTNANVTAIVTDSAETTVESLVVKTLDGNTFNVRGKTYVLACGGWENARILLASKGANGNGVGNKFDNVGRYYNEHPKILGSKLFLYSKTLRSLIMFWKRKIAKDGFVRLGIKISEELQEKHRLTNNNIELMYPKTMSDAIAQSETLFNNLGFSRSTIHNFVKLAPYVFSLADAFERMLFNLPLKFEHVTMVSHMEQIQDRDSRLILSDEKDVLGMPKLKVKLNVNKRDKDNMKIFHKVLAKLFEDQGLGRLESELPDSEEHWPELTDSSHHNGTTRMSEDPSEGVVDKDCRVHGINNLYIAGSSVFPTGGHVNPTFTIIALSLRLAEHLKGVHKI